MNLFTGQRLSLTVAHPAAPVAHKASGKKAPPAAPAAHATTAAVDTMTVAGKGNAGAGAAHAPTNTVAVSSSRM
jgi:hypothetical protein